MENCDWIFSGIGTEIVSLLIGLLVGFSGYKIIKKKKCVQKQFAKDNANQRQEMEINSTDNLKKSEKNNVNLKQIQKAGNNSVQVQIGRINNGK